MNELKRCPFCGGKAIITYHAKRKICGTDRYMTGVAIGCDTCEARMFYGSVTLAIESWNRRARNE